MPASPRRYDLLASRLRAFTRELPRVKSADPRATDRAWTASRRLRELLPMLQLDGPTVEKLAVRIRRVTRRLRAVHQSDVLLALLDELDETDRRGRLARGRVRDDVQRLSERAHAELFRRKIGNDVRRVSEKLASVLQTLRDQQDSPTRTRDLDWAAKARVARRATDLKDAINAAGSVYLPARLDTVRASLRKLRYGAELVSEAGDSVAASDVRALARVQTLLGSLDEVQMLIDRARHVQGSLATPDLKAWRDLDGLIVSLENRCRGLHARYVRERTALVALCDRLVARSPADRSAKRKVG
jgi:hypothetical protein